MIPSKARVIRDGEIQEIEATHLTIGDLIILSNGEKIPADIRLLSCNEMKVDNSSITGESDPQERNIKTKPTANPLESANMVFSGNMIVNGEGIGVVVRTGDNTMLGQIACLTVAETKRSSQLTREIDVFVKKIACVAIITAIIFFVVGIVIGYGVGVNFSFAIGVFVAFVPQGLPVTVMILLTISAKKLSSLNVLVKDLHGVETLGSITMLATDKTGTLTQNKMTAVGCWINSSCYSLATVLESDDSEDKCITGTEENFSELLNALCLCSK